MKKIYLVCNAHLDPVWLWQKNEGMAEAMSTFRIAADFCEKYDEFVFCHNESLLYEWVLENDPRLFERIKALIKQGKWRIIGGWYLQPDMVMPCGESIIRQIRVGNEFFKEHFRYVPKTAIGFDAFGHSRGAVQILKKCGYENYVYLRPRNTECGPFIWKGFDDSKIFTYKLYEWYNTPKGQALERIENYIKDFPDRKVNLLTWGIGNHGGGPSEKDLNDINNFSKTSNIEFIHSDFDVYFNEINIKDLPIVDKALTHCMVGCYTSMVRVKQGHRALENKLAICEKMLCHSGIKYDEKKLLEAEKALLFTEFHDVLPGSAIKRVEEDSLRLIGYGNEILDRLISKSFFALCDGQPKANIGEIPVLIYNPHPYEIVEDFEVEFQMAEQNHPSNGIYDVLVHNEKGEYIPSQIEQEDSAHGMDWRKKVVFNAILEPMSITRLDCELKLQNDTINCKLYTENEDSFILNNEYSGIKISKKTGLLEGYLLNGQNLLNSMKIKAFSDNADPWGMLVEDFSECIGEFELYRGVRVIESGEVRTKIQADFKWNKSYAVVTYTFSKNNKFIDIDIKTLINDENTMFKLCLDTNLDKNSNALGQTMFGTEVLRKDGKETVFQKWCGLKDESSSLYIINSGTYGGSFNNNEISISILRTPVYSAHPVDDVELAPDNRIYNHIDMGERDFNFRLLANEDYVDFEAEKYNQKPYVLSFFPSGLGEKTEKPLVLDNKNIILSALKKENNGKVLIRLYNSSFEKQTAILKFEEKSLSVDFTPFEVKTFVKNENTVIETDMLGKHL